MSTWLERVEYEGRDFSSDSHNAIPWHSSRENQTENLQESHNAARP